jgi:hypothetical protein
MSKKYVTYTSTLPNIVMEDVVEYAKKKKVSKNKVIEIALKMLFEEEMRKDLEITFGLASEDKELTGMAEWGLDEYSKQLKNMEK